MDITPSDYYGDDYARITGTLSLVLKDIDEYKNKSKSDDEKQVIYVSGRIKSPDSLRNKLIGKGYHDGTYQDALEADITDIVGVRVVVAFMDSIYEFASWVKERGWEVIREKDYIANPKPSGYRSLHLIVMAYGMPVEIQIRTMSMDAWATLEHKVKYKHEVRNEAVIRRELKRCSDEMASADLTMMSIRNIIKG